MIPPLPLEFLGSFPDPLHPLDPPRAEVALLGRSNVGKSSLLNALAGRRKLARISGTPGKTDLLNVYGMPAGYLLDLPGYGYARRSRTERAGFRTLVDGVIAGRPGLAGVVWLLDARHSPSRDDLAMHDLLIERARPTLVVLTKSDKLTPAEQRGAPRERGRELGIAEAQVLLTSSTTGLGIEELRSSILAVLGSDRPA